MIFTPINLAVGEDIITKKTNFNGRWFYNFKWKPPEENTIDFLVYFEKEDDNNNTIEFPHELFAEGYKYKLTDIKIIFLIFEKIFQRNHLNNINSKMPINFINFKELILKELKSHLND